MDADDILPVCTRWNVNEAERIMKENTPVALLFLEGWVYSFRPSSSVWQFTYSGSGVETPTETNMNRHKNMIVQALPGNAKLLSFGLLQRTETSRYQATVQRINSKGWLAWCERRNRKNKSVPLKYLTMMGATINTQRNLTTIQ